MASIEDLAESTPTIITPEIENFVKALDCERAFYIPVMPEEGAQPGRSFQNASEAIRDHGGSLCFGWLIRECLGLWVTAEFYAVVATPLGRFIDVTPNDSHEGQVLFAPDNKHGANFDFRNSPNSVRQRTYHLSAAHVEADIEAMSERRRRYEEQRAKDKGLSLADARTSGNPGLLVQAIDDYLGTLAKVDSVFVYSSRGRMCRDPGRLVELRYVVERAQRRLARALEVR